MCIIIVDSINVHNMLYRTQPFRMHMFGALYGISKEIGDV